MRLAQLLLVLASFASRPVVAVPRDASVALRLRQVRIEKLDAGFSALLVEPEGVVRAELLPTDELVLEAQQPGRARVFLYARHLVRVVEVDVDFAPPAPQARAPSRCGNSVRDAACYRELRQRLLDGEDLPALQFELEGLQAEAKAAQDALAQRGLGHVTVALSPYGVRLKGARDEAELRRGLAAIWPAMLGPLRIDR